MKTASKKLKNILDGKMININEYLLSKNKKQPKDYIDVFPDKPLYKDDFILFFENHGFIEITHKRGNNLFNEISSTNEAVYTYAKHKTKMGDLYYEFVFKGKGFASKENKIYHCEVTENEKYIEDHYFGDASYNGKEYHICWPSYEKFREDVLKNLFSDDD